jgi:glyoxylase-like metal-dependent hydrolase (beta-lactamase superfamily II)
VTSIQGLPAHLAQTEAKGLVPGETIAQFELGELRNFVYLILDWSTQKAAWIDPQKDVDTPLEALREHGFELSFVLLTHGHHDHIAGIPELMKRFAALPVYVHEKDVKRLSESARKRLSPLQDGTSLQLGEIEIDVLHTPGHTSGECSYFLTTDRPYVFTGDTIFIRDCGRTDFDTGSNDEMFQSIQRIKTLPTNTVILPGHHYAPECATTVAKELKESPPFQCQSVKELASLP